MISREILAFLFHYSIGYHTLAYASTRTLALPYTPLVKKNRLVAMTKLSVLVIFAETKTFLTPCQVCRNLRPTPDIRSLYSYLARLQGQGLLERGTERRRGYLSYRITEKGHKRISYLQAQIDPNGQA